MRSHGEAPESSGQGPGGAATPGMRGVPGAGVSGAGGARLGARLRVAVEWALRVLVLALLVWSLVLALGVGGAGVTERASTETLSESLVRWTTVARPGRVHVDFEHPPAGVERDWLGALVGAGTHVSWSGPSLLPTALALEPRADPAGGVEVSVSAPLGARVVLRDTLGVLDSARVEGAGGVRAYVARPRATLDAAVGRVVARAGLADSLALKRLLVLGAAGWETKFVIAALEERGWAVDAEVRVSPETTVRQGRVAAIDTSRYSAVLVLDTTAAAYADRIGRYVRAGGGLVLWSPAVDARRLAALAPGRERGAVIEDEGRPPGDSVPREALSIAPITGLVPEAVVLERRGEHVTLAARRLGAGRVVETGYVNTWRWRLAGGEEEAPERHRTWLAGLVASVAYAGREELAVPPTNAAPLATLIDRLGPAVAEAYADAGGGMDPAVLARWLFAALCLALLVEWASRRTRGAR